MKFLVTMSNVLNKILMIVGGIAVLSLMVLATGNVVLRVFHFPFRGPTRSSPSLERSS